MGPIPPELCSSDDDSEFENDGFVFSGDYDEFGERIRREKPMPVVNIEDETGRHLYRCIFENDIDGFRELWSHVSHRDIDRSLKTFDWSPLMFACQCRHVEFVRYLLFEMHANPNANSNDMTALILVCSGPFDMYGGVGTTTNEISTKDEADTLQICEMLLDGGGAMVDKANLRRETALMYAAGNGFESVVKFLLDRKATLEACDRDDCTALFYAVRENRYQVVELLIKAGALVETEDRDGRTPKQCAQELGFDNLLELFPPDPIFEYVPHHFTSYDTPYDLIPTAFPDKETPAYSPDVYQMLHGMRANRVEYKFYEAKIGLPEFLTITDERLQQIGIDYPYHRKRILLGLLQFHDRPWSKDALTIPKIKTNIVDMFNVLSSCLKQLIVIETTIKFVDEHPIFATTPMSIAAKQQRLIINQELRKMRKNIQQILNTFEKIDTLSPVPPILIDKQTIQNALDMSKTFRAQFYRKISIFSCIGVVGIGVALAVIKLRTR